MLILFIEWQYSKKLLNICIRIHVCRRGCKSARIYVIYNESMRVTLLAFQMSFYEIRLGLFDTPHNIECVTRRKNVITFQLKFAELHLKFEKIQVKLYHISCNFYNFNLATL